MKMLKIKLVCLKYGLGSTTILEMGPSKKQTVYFSYIFSKIRNNPVFLWDIIFELTATLGE